MGRKKKTVVVTKVFCYYCDREFDDEHTLVQHQRVKHFKCHVCHKKFSTAGSMVIHVQHVHREQVTKVPYAIEGRDSTEIEIYGMQGIPPDLLAAYYGEDGDDTLSKMARVEVPTVQLVGGVVPSLLGSYPPQPPFGMPPMYNAAVSLPYNGWQVAPLPLPWYSQPPAVSVPPPPGVGYPQQPMFPVQSPLPSSLAPGLQSSFVHPPGVPASFHPVSVSQPLFPLVGVNNVPSQSSPFSAPMLLANSPSNPLGSVDAYPETKTSIHTSNIPEPVFPMAMSTTPALFYGGCAPVIPMTYTTTPTYGYDGYAPATNLVCSGCPYPCCNLHQLQSHQPRPPSHLISQQHQWSPPSHGDHLFPPAGSFAPPPPPQQQWGPQLHGDHLPPPPSSFTPPSHHYYHTQYYHPQQLNQDWGAQSRQAATWDLEVGKEISREEDHHFEPARQLFDETPDRKAEAEFQVDEQATPVATVSFVLEVGNGISIDKRCCQSETARQVFAEMPQPKSEAQVLEGSFGWELGQNSADDGMHFEASGGIFHTDVQCDGCGSHPIVGPRFKSTVKDDYDLCCICFSSVDDESEYIRIDHPVSYPLDEKNDEDDDIPPITFSGKKKNSSKACKKSGGNSFSTALLENEDDANDTISKPTTVVDGTVEDEEESMITYTGKKKSSKKRGKGNGMSAALVESAESTGLIEPEQPATTALLSDGVSEAAQIYCELVGLGANMKDIDIGGGLGIDYDRTSIDVLKKDGLMATHDEDTENFFNDTEVNCVLCLCNPDDNERIVPGGDAALVHLSTCVPAIKDKLEDADEELGEGCSDSTRPVRLQVSDGSVMEANHVIVTVSLGVLKAAIHQESEMFSPPLPFYKVDAISRLGIGVVNKLFLQLSRSSHVVKGQGFFSKFPFLQMVFRRQDSELRLKKIPWWMRKTASVCPLHHSTSVLLYWVAGKETLELKSLSDDEIIDGVATPIDNFMKDSHKNEEIRKDANTMAQLFQSNPDLASVILGNDLNKLQEVLRQIHRQKVEHQRQQEEENALHFADPFDVEAQKKIEAAIRQKGIDENWVAALEHNPEAFARVVMLCVDMEETLKKHVEINHACKVLKSDARLVAHGKHDFEQKLHAIGMVSDIGHYKSIVAGMKLIGSCNYFTNGKLDDQQYVVQCENVNDDKEIVIHLAYGENEDMYIKNIHVTIIRGKNEEVVEDGSCGHTIDLVGLDQLSTKNAILAACSHSRLVDTIIDIFNSMAGKYEMDAAGLNTSSLDDETFKLETAQDQCILRLIDYAKQSSSYGEDQNSRYGGSSNFGGYDFRRSQNHYGSGSYGYGGSPVGMAATPFHGASGFYVADSYAYASYNGASYNGGESSVVDYAGSAAYGGTYWNSYVDDSTSYNGASYNGCVTDAVGTAGSMTLEEGLLNDNICEVFFHLDRTKGC